MTPLSNPGRHTLPEDGTSGTFCHGGGTVIEINSTLAIPESEISFTASLSSGPGGQHVNKTSTRVTLRFDVSGSSTLSEAQKEILRKRLSGRISREGVLQVSSQQFRSQSMNRDDTLRRFVTLLRNALKPVPQRRRTRPPRSAVERRIEAKKKRGERKKERSGPLSRY
jgi:ribosome-associated protein